MHKKIKIFKCMYVVLYLLVDLLIVLMFCYTFQRRADARSPLGGWGGWIGWGGWRGWGSGELRVLRRLGSWGG